MAPRETVISPANMHFPEGRELVVRKRVGNWVLLNLGHGDGYEIHYVPEHKSQGRLPSSMVNPVASKVRGVVRLSDKAGREALNRIESFMPELEGTIPGQETSLYSRRKREEQLGELAKWLQSAKYYEEMFSVLSQ